jgi:HEAT repeat protein
MRKSLLIALAALVVGCAAGRAADTDDKVVNDLIAEFKDTKNTPEVRSAAIRVLGAMGWPGKAAVPDLIKLLNNADERKAAREALGPYYQAIEALGRIGPPAREAVPSLVKAAGLAAPYDHAIHAALENILIAPHGSLEALLNSLHDNDPSVRLMAAKALRNYPAEAHLVLPHLREATRDPDADVKRVAEESVTQVTKQEVERLTQLLKDSDANVRMLAARALGRMGSSASSAVLALSKAANDDKEDADVRCVAKNALEKITKAPSKP